VHGAAASAALGINISARIVWRAARAKHQQAAQRAAKRQRKHKCGVNRRNKWRRRQRINSISIWRRGGIVMWHQRSNAAAAGNRVIKQQEKRNGGNVSSANERKSKTA